MMIRSLCAATLLLMLAACGDGSGTAISFNATDADGNLAGGIDSNGEMKIDSPVFTGKITLPKLKLDANNFDMNGVHLYPGSTISAINIAGEKGKDGGHVRVNFASPAAPGVVRDWFRDKLNAAKFKLSNDGTGLIGKTDEDKPFKLELTPDGDAKSKGVITIE